MICVWQFYTKPQLLPKKKCVRGSSMNIKIILDSALRMYWNMMHQTGSHPNHSKTYSSLIRELLLQVFSCFPLLAWPLQHISRIEVSSHQISFLSQDFCVSSSGIPLTEPFLKPFSLDHSEKVVEHRAIALLRFLQKLRKICWKLISLLISSNWIRTFKIPFHGQNAVLHQFQLCTWRPTFSHRWKYLLHWRKYLLHWWKYLLHWWKYLLH